MGKIYFIFKSLYKDAKRNIMIYIIRYYDHTILLSYRNLFEVNWAEACTKNVPGNIHCHFAIYNQFPRIIVDLFSVNNTDHLL